MHYLLISICFLFISCGDEKKETTISEESSTTTYYLIRHAEKDRNVSEDPGLIAKGTERAQFWARYFETIELDAIYSTKYNRTKETAAPTAKAQGLAIQSYDPSKLFDESFQEATLGKNVLIVGHSNTTPAFVNTIIGERKYEDISDTENGMLYTVVLRENGQSDVTVKTVPVSK